MKLKSILIISLILAILTISAVSASDGNMTSDELESDDFTDDEAIINVSVPEEIMTGIPFEVTFKGSDDLNGQIEAYGDDFIFESTNMVNGTGKMSLYLSSSGNHKIDYSFSNGETYYDSIFNVTVVDLFDVSVPESVYAGNTATITFTGPKNINGDVELDIDDGSGPCFITIKNGKGSANVKIPYRKSISYEFFSKTLPDIVYGSFKINVLKKPTIKANNFKTDYASKKAYKVRVLDEAGNPVGSGKQVTFQLYKAGKKVATKTAKTDKSSYAGTNFNVAPGSYKVKAKYGPATVTKKYTVNTILKIKNEKRKDIHKNRHKSSKIVWSVYLKKVDGKYLKGKKIKFDLYEQRTKGTNTYLVKVKTFTAKTNSRGVATLTFNKSPVKVSAYNMRMGMAYPIKVTFSKDRLRCGDTIDPHYTLYGQYPYDYYYGPTWCGI